jgi:hypothetical protein
LVVVNGDDVVDEARLGTLLLQFSDLFVKAWPRACGEIDLLLQLSTGSGLCKGGGGTN